MSYRRTGWVSYRALLAARAPLVRAFIKKFKEAGRDASMQEGVDPEWKIAHRWVAVHWANGLAHDLPRTLLLRKNCYAL